MPAQLLRTGALQLIAKLKAFFRTSDNVRSACGYEPEFSVHLEVES